jgi:hypothetical protein
LKRITGGGDKFMRGTTFIERKIAENLDNENTGDDISAAGLPAFLS